jgi:hypothetical protein
VVAFERAVRAAKRVVQWDAVAMPSILFVVVSGPAVPDRARQAFESAHAILASGMAERVEVLLSGEGVGWVARASGPDDGGLSAAVEAGVRVYACTRALADRALLDRLEQTPSIEAAGAPTLIAGRAGAGWTLLVY